MATEARFPMTWWRRIRRWLGKFVGLTVPSILLAILLFEILARLFLPVSDFPRVIFDEELGNHFGENQRGVYIKGPDSEIRATYRINNHGWNSTNDYTIGKPVGHRRIAVIGDSFVEALQVDVDAAFPSLLEGELAKAGVQPRVEVYSFGRSGANFFQYVKVLEHVLTHFAPHDVIITVVPNDYAESLEGFSRKDNWSLRPVDGRLEPVPPQRAGNFGLKRALRHSASARYLIINLDLVTRWAVVRRLFYGDTRPPVENLEDRQLGLLADTELRERLMQEIMGQIVAESRASRTRVGFLLESPHGPIYEGRAAEESIAWPFIATARDVATSFEVPVLELDRVFRQAWRRDGQRFEWNCDGHWNYHAHRVVSRAVSEWLETWPPRPTETEAEN